MGFYGNITNVNKSTFQFDKTYSNAAEMLINAASDGVFVGRYVLVDYDKDLTPTSILEALQDNAELINEWGASNFLPAYKILHWNESSSKYEDGSSNGELSINNANHGFYAGLPTVGDNGEYTLDGLKKYSSEDLAENNFLLVLGHITERTYIEHTGESDQIVTKIDRFLDIKPELWQVILEENKFVRLSETAVSEAYDKLGGNVANRYALNYRIDYNYFNEKSGGQNLGRGYDSTVWQKVFRDGVMSYAMIAELNSVVPTFDITVDPPTEPITLPHWDDDTSNLYYNLHVQPTWGFRVQTRADYNTNNAPDIPASEIDANNKTSSIAQAIYWNEAGFNKFYKSEVDGGNKIAITKGQSGKIYRNANGVTSPADDTYELSIMLPQIGNIVSGLWDLVYGQPYKYDATGHTLLGDGNIIATDLKPIRNTNLDWNSKLGERMTIKRQNNLSKPEPGYNPEALNNFAGIINSVHDLMGMIIIKTDIPQKKETESQETYQERLQAYYDGLDSNNIYYDENTNKYYYKEKKYIFDKTEENIKIGPMIQWPDGEHDLYRLKSFEYKKEDGSFATGYNYYRVQEEEALSEDESYGFAKITTPDPSLTQENYNPTSTNSDEWVWINEKENGEINPYNFIRKTGELSEDDGAYYHITNIEAVKSGALSEEKSTWPHFYVPDRYYIGIKNLNTMGADATWNVTDENLKADDFDSIMLCRAATLKDALIAAGAASIVNGEFTINTNIGYKFLLGIEVDPKASSYALVDANLIQEPITSVGDAPGLLVDETYIKKVSLSEGAEPVYVYEYAGVTEVLQNCEEFTVTSTTTKDNPDFNEELEVSETNPRTIEEIVEQKYVKYLGSQYRDSGTNLLKTLNSWKEFIESQSEEDENRITVEDLTLTKEEKLVPELVKPSYSLAKASIVSNLEDFDGEYCNYYYAVTTEYFNRLTKASIQQFYKYGDGQARADWFKISVSNAFIYYKLDDEYYIPVGEDLIRVTNQTLAGFDSVSDFKKVQWNPQHVFIPNTYYKKVENSYELASVYENDVDYYRYPDRFVIADQNNFYALGARWNPEVPIPVYTVINEETGEETEVPYVTVGYKNYVWELRELPNFADQINTIHGLILKINKMLLEGDVETRDRATAQGAINTLNDIIDKFDQLVPAEIAMVDAYGRVHTGDWDSKQKLGYENIGKPSASQAIPTGEPVAADDERWVKLTTTPGVAPDFKPHIKLEHTLGHSAAPTTTTADKNHDGLIGNGLNAAHGDTIDLYTPIVDNMGHVIGKNTETVTLPYGFKTVFIGAQSTEAYDTTSNSDSAVAGTTLDKSYSGNGNLIADNTQDILAINTGNKWIRIKNNISDSDGSTLTNDGFTISHEVHSINISDSVSTDINDLVDNHINDIINIPDWDYDNAGHIIEKHNHEYTLPYGFKTIKVTNDDNTVTNGASTVVQDGQSADNSQDTLTFSASNKWIKLDNGTDDTIKVGHLVQNIDTSDIAGTNINGNGDTITLKDFTIDEAGHVRTYQDHVYTLPYGFKTITGNNGSLVADNTQDIIALSGDNWIQTTASADGVVFTHIGPSTPVTHTLPEPIAANAVTPNFGGTFTIEDWRFDEKGHKAGLQTHTVEMPDLELVSANSATSGNVVTALTIADNASNDGKVFTKTEANVGTLRLTGYSLNENGSSESAIAATDSLNTALQRLEYRLNKEITDRGTTLTTTIQSLNADLDASGTLQHNGTFVISGVTETDGVITAVDSIEVETAGAAAAALDSAIGSASDASSADTINGAKLYASEVATTAQENAIAAIKTETFTYSPLIANPEYDSSDPTSEEYIRDENNSITKTIEDWITYIMDNNL